jgi:hypothetical protein
MASARIQLVALLIATVIFGAAQCMASCAALDTKPVAPPCHQHQAPGHEEASCGHDFLLPDAHRSSIDLGIAIGLPELTIEIAHSFADTASLIPAISPPGRLLSPSSILRI